jgi:transcriptional regulator with XRE-family HTH domain
MHELPDTQSVTVPADRFDLATFGGRLSYALVLAQKTQRELAQAVNVTNQAITKLCHLKEHRTGSRRLPEIASFLGIPVDWLAYGIGVPPTARTRTGVEPSTRNPRLSDLQAATLDKLELLMVAGAFDDMACLKLLTGLKPKLAAL